MNYLLPGCKRVNIFDSKFNQFGDPIAQIPIEIKFLKALAR